MLQTIQQVPFAGELGFNPLQEPFSHYHPQGTDKQIQGFTSFPQQQIDGFLVAEEPFVPVILMLQKRA